MLIAHRGVPAGGDPDPEPAVAEPRGAADRRIRSSAHDERYRRRRRRQDQGVVEREELAVEGDRRAVGQASQDLKAFVHPASTRLRVDAADLDLVAVLAADPDAEREPAGRELRDRRELAGNGDRVAQWQQVQPDIHRQRGLRREQRGCADQPVGTRADEEADVIADTQVVDARVGDLSRASRAAAPDRRRSVRARRRRARRGHRGRRPFAVPIVDDVRAVSPIVLRSGATGDERPDDRRHCAP